MSRTLKDKIGNSRDSVEVIRQALRAYHREHPKAVVDVKRQNPVAVRIRIVDPDFTGIDLIDREKTIWKILDKLPAKVRADITFVLLITPKEKGGSLANYDFDNPIPSRL
jgi:stress-induced morphogen